MDKDMYYGGQCPICGGGLTANHGLNCKGMYADKPVDLVVVRREDLAEIIRITDRKVALWDRLKAALDIDPAT